MTTLDGKLRNWTLFRARPFLLHDRHGREQVVVVAKITYDVAADGTVHVAHEQAPIRIRDEPAGSLPGSSIARPSDRLDEKPGTDVLLIGRAYPPPGQTVTEVGVELHVRGEDTSISKAARVFGPRVWERGVGGVRPGPAAPLHPTPLMWELAWGGTDRSDDGRVLADWRNPVGSGIARDPKRLVGEPAHRIEDPSDPQRPAGFGPVAADWEPRRSRAGTYDAAWQRHRAPFRPADFDPRHNACAPEGLWSETPLLGDETIHARHVTPEGSWTFRLPLHRPVFRADLAGRTAALDTHLDTLLIDAERRRVELVWRARFPAPRKLARLERIRVITGDPVPPIRATDEPRSARAVLEDPA